MQCNALDVPYASSRRGPDTRGHSLQDRPRIDAMSACDKQKYKATLSQLGQAVKKDGQRVTELKAVSECKASLVCEFEMCILKTMWIQACAQSLPNPPSHA